MDQASLSQAFAHHGAGAFDQAERICREALARDSADADANHLLGILCFQQGRNEDARVLLARAAESANATPEMHNNFGGVLNTLGDHDGAVAAFIRALQLNPDYADAYNNLGVAHRDAARTEAAIKAFQRAVALQPGHGAAKANLRAAYRDVIPAWHFAMLDDRKRNDSYQAAIARAVPGKRVLDIGTGTGLLAMMAARAGAQSVVSCESIGIIAERARGIVAENGLASRVTVIASPSTDLAVGDDFPLPAEVLVTETFSSGLISEGVLPTVEHAHAHLLAPDAAVIPQAASAMGYLAGGDTLGAMLFVGDVNGFALGSFNDFAPPHLSILLDHVPHTVLSDDIELLRFDLREKQFPIGRKKLTVRVTAPGLCAGVAQWIRLDLDAEARYENRPAPDADFNGHWSHILYRFPERIAVAPGDLVHLTVRNDRTQISVELAE
jgi:type II protein arginine methyltransferase